MRCGSLRGRNALLILALAGIAAAPDEAEAKGGVAAKVPKFLEADNGLPAAVALRGGDYLTRVILHFAGLDPPLEWVPPPKHWEIFPDWVDEPIARPAAPTVIGRPACAEDNLNRLAQRLQSEAAAPILAAEPRAEGLIRLDGPVTQSHPSPAGAESETYGAGCIIPGG